MSKAFYRDMLERAIKTFAEALLAVLTLATTMGDLDWATAFSTAFLAAIISVLSSIVSSNIGDSSASLVNTEEDEE